MKQRHTSASSFGSAYPNYPRTGKPREVLTSSPDAPQLASLWPEQASVHQMEVLFALVC